MIILGRRRATNRVPAPSSSDHPSPRPPSTFFGLLLHYTVSRGRRHCPQRKAAALGLGRRLLGAQRAVHRADARDRRRREVGAVRRDGLLHARDRAARGLLGDLLVGGRRGLRGGLGALGRDLDAAAGALADVDGLVVDEALAARRCLFVFALDCLSAYCCQVWMAGVIWALPGACGRSSPWTSHRPDHAAVPPPFTAAAAGQKKAHRCTCTSASSRGCPSRPRTPRRAGSCAQSCGLR